jgi:hypothetical protein
MMNVRARWVGVLPEQKNQESGEGHTVLKKIDVGSRGIFPRRVFNNFIIKWNKKFLIIFIFIFDLDDRTGRRK